MNRKFIVAILLIAVPVCAQAQKPSPAKVTKADAQRVLKIIQSDKAKTKIYCEMAKIGNQLEQINEEADPKKFEELSRKMDEMGKRLGPEYGALIDGLQDVDPRSEVGQEISSTLEALDHLCGR
jgi:peptidoglycan hydrolase CwlO-like protein